MAARAGYDFVSLRPIYMGLPGEPNFSLATNKTLLRETKKALQDTGLGLLDIELARIADGVDPGCTNRKWRWRLNLGLVMC